MPGKHIVAFNQLIAQKYNHHDKYELTTNINQALCYFNDAIQGGRLETLMREASESDRKKNVLRAPFGANGLAVHINYYDIKETTANLNHEIDRLDKCCQKMLAETNPKTQARMITGFLDRVIDSPVGCIEARLDPAERYIETGILIINDEFDTKSDLYVSQEDGSFNIGNIIDGFYDFVQAQVQSRNDRYEEEDKAERLTWNKIRNYCTQIDEDFEESWQDFHQHLPNVSINTPQPSGQTLFHYYQFATENEAKIYLGYVKSLIPDVRFIDNADVIYAAHIDAKKPFGFKLSDGQRYHFEQKVASFALKSLDPAIAQLYAALDAMQKHGETLVKEDKALGTATKKLSADLLTEANALLKGPLNQLQKNWATFDTKFRATLHRHDDDAVMSNHRTAWKPILGNILIALTGIGLIVIGIKCAVSACSKQGFSWHHGLFGATTTREDKITAVDEAMNVIKESLDMVL